ncbi:hypothetical protein [Orenia marismortui]|uniref:HTH cro/C1-type domain-containing protein n=1 Tax=Orenia marismortui TaxID=46469 RepID=A0A4R8GG27_9FIRM|nr:hypothetical protein [Orenia marismortui]TDX44586.1 hypothetical protein C7959_15010 [Orenia marismortui]
MKNPFRTLRSKLGITRKEMSDLLNVNYNLLNQLENNLTDKIFPCVKQALSQELDLDIEELTAEWNSYKAFKQKEVKKKIS